jgi:hypothetical protein
MTMPIERTRKRSKERDIEKDQNRNRISMMPTF